MKKSVTGRKGLWIVAVLLPLALSMRASGFTQTGERADCPGKVVCPVTGDKICKDQCPLVDGGRADCPGKIECPLTGEPVCRDRCPLGASKSASTTEADRPSCCRNRQ